MTLLDLFLLFGKGEFIYADTASVPPEYKACLCSSCEDHIDDNHHTGYSFDQEDGEVIAKGLSTEPDNFLPQRLNLYNAFETKDYDNGIQQTSGFFNTPNGKFIWQDYLYQDRLLNATQQYEPSFIARFSLHILTAIQPLVSHKQVPVIRLIIVFTPGSRKNLH